MRPLHCHKCQAQRLRQGKWLSACPLTLEPRHKPKLIFRRGSWKSDKMSWVSNPGLTNHFLLKPSLPLYRVAPSWRLWRKLHMDKNEEVTIIRSAPAENPCSNTRCVPARASGTSASRSLGCSDGKGEAICWI